MEEDKEVSSSKKLRRYEPPATAASLFTDDLIMEILSRLPARSVCRFKCVSTPWRDLIADPVNRKRLRQTLAGFLYTTYKPPGGAWSHHFASVSGSAAPFDPSLPFLQLNQDEYIAYVDTCNGLLLCARLNKETPAAYKDRYVVCNPATERWIELPPKPQAGENIYHGATRLAFDPTVSSHFHVLEFGESILGPGSYVTEVVIFSSQTGAWIHRHCRLVEKITVFHGYRSVFFGGMLHLVGKLNPTSIDGERALLVVDMEGKAWKTIRLPDAPSWGAIGLSQGCFYYSSTTRACMNNSTKKNDVRATEITLWCLENYDAKEWALKHSASIDEPSGITGVDWCVFAIHPHRDAIFLNRCGRDLLASYDVQHQKLVHILNLEKDSIMIYLPYVPLFSEALADTQWQ